MAAAVEGIVSGPKQAERAGALRRYKPYPAYKDSGVEWLGEIPAHWEARKLKWLTDCLDGRRVPLNAEERGRMQGDYPYWGANSIVDYVDRWLFDEELVLLGEDGAPFFDRSKPVAFRVSGKIWVNNHTHVLRPRRGVDAAFLAGALNCVDYRAFIDGTTRDKLTQGDMRSIPIQFLPQAEQRAIAAFLDRETARIDALVAKKERLIELLLEKRTALITRAVTKGLDPNVPTKDSGVEWLGQIPAHWEVKRVRDLAESLQTGPFGSQLHADEYVIGGFPVINPANLRDGRLVPDEECAVSDDVADRLAHHRLQGGDILFARRGELGRCGLVTGRETGWICGTGCLRLRVNLAMAVPHFLIRLASTNGVADWLGLQSVGSTMQNLNTSIIGRIPVIMPPTAEQRTIATFLDREVARIDALVAKVREAIDRLKELRTALISAAVTGKIDVRAASAEASAGQGGAA